ncbi:ABC transporter ATP-binding protein [Vineibacter terrae]|uniref:ABC transporter ATP-binding protein n=1 Tax=Vineibacter terrae TaxID=2586908 RepID=A0A5C8PSM9_9HYPH|nr:ABC transporter ATP-binding protein [Vineibacter terrae]TXL80285.1 ABC transporter ATP-binding protein [Vineibacter terrae]
MSAAAAEGPLLQVKGLQVRYFTERGTIEASRGVTLHLDRGETLGLVGESGSGKSVTSQAILGLIREPGRIVAGDIVWKGRSLLAADGAAYARRVRGKEIALVFQDPMTSLNPVFTIGLQITEVLRHHLKLGRRAASDRAAELLDLVGISAPRQRLAQYPHELSGGMRQRALIAMALSCEPELLVADEPTTALDVTIQAQILELLGSLQQRLGLSILLITHDLGVVAALCHRVAVIYAGRIVETGRAADLFARPAHPYTMGLLRSTPRIDVVRPRLVAIDGTPPDLSHPPAGCAFHTRCPIATDACMAEAPSLVPQAGGRTVACWRAFTPAWPGEAANRRARG